MVQQLLKQNKIADKGNTLSFSSGKTVCSNGNIEDIPHSDSKEIVTGYVIIHVEIIDEAVRIAKENPVLKAGGSIEVREVARFIKRED